MTEIEVLEKLVRLLEVNVPSDGDMTRAATLILGEGNDRIVLNLARNPSVEASLGAISQVLVEAKALVTPAV